MTKLEELVAAYYAARDASAYAARDDAYAAAWAVHSQDAFAAYQAELKKIKEENSNEYDQVQEGDGSTV